MSDLTVGPDDADGADGADGDSAPSASSAPSALSASTALLGAMAPSAMTTPSVTTAPGVATAPSALSAPTVLARVIDIFHDWDEDGSGTVSKREFTRALPMLGLTVAKAEAEALFDLFDGDGSGTIEYGELKKQLRKHARGHTSSKASTMPRLPQLGRSTANTAAAGASSTAAELR